MPRSLTQQVVTSMVLASAVANNGTVTVAYPSGYTQANFIGGLASATGVAIINKDDQWLESAAKISLSYGASNITLTNLSGVSWPAGATLDVGLGRISSFVGNAATYKVVIPINSFAALANSQVYKRAMPHAFKVVDIGVRVTAAVTTAAKAATLTAQITGTAVTGGAVSLTSANATPVGALVAGSAITAGNTGNAGDTLEAAISAVTTFVEGGGEIEFTVINTELQTALAAAL